MEVRTPDSMEYNFFPVKTLRKTIAIKAAHDAHVSFTSEGSDTIPMIEFILGGWGNTKSTIRLNRESPDRAEVETPGLLAAEEHREFTFEWAPNGRLFQVYGGADTVPFLSWKNMEQPFTVTHFGVRTVQGASGDWICDGVNYVGTVDCMEYNYNPVEPVAGRLEFQVKAGNDAHVCLTGGPADEGPIHEFVIGGWENSRCSIRHNRGRPGVVEENIQAPLTKENFRSFWIDWNCKEIKFGVGNAPAAFLTWTSPIVHPVTHFGIRTAYGSDGSWIIPSDGVTIQTGEISFGGHNELDSGASPVAPGGFGFGWVSPGGGPFQEYAVAGEPNQSSLAAEKLPAGGFDWVPSKGGAIPEDAVPGGQDGGEPIYVARAQHEQDLLPGKLVPSHGVVYVAWGGGEHGKESYEVLVAAATSVTWVPASAGSVPGNAIPGGLTGDGETLFIGRAPHESTVTIGKIHPSHGSLYIAYGGEEIGFPEYEVLVKN